MSVKTYHVARAHEGDRFYSAGETRDLNSGDAANLLRLGVLVDAPAGPGSGKHSPGNGGGTSGVAGSKGKLAKAKTVSTSAQIEPVTVNHVAVNAKAAASKAEPPVVESKAEGAAPENKVAASVADAKDGAATDGSSDAAATDAGA